MSWFSLQQMIKHCSNWVKDRGRRDLTGLSLSALHHCSFVYKVQTQERCEPVKKLISTKTCEDLYNSLSLQFCAGLNSELPSCLWSLAAGWAFQLVVSWCRALFHFCGSLSEHKDRAKSRDGNSCGTDPGLEPRAPDSSPPPLCFWICSPMLLPSVWPLWPIF